MSANFPGGWNDLVNANPAKISNVVAYAAIGATAGTIKNSIDFNSPTGTWVTSPITISSLPTVVAVNAATEPEEDYGAKARNIQTKTANLSASLAPPLRNLIYLYGNENGALKYEMDIPLNLGGDNFNSIQLSILENAGTSGNMHSTIQVIDFGVGPWTGVITLKLSISGYYGPVHFGLRINKVATNDTSIYDIRAIILPIVSLSIATEENTLMSQINGGNVNSQNPIQQLMNQDTTTTLDEICKGGRFLKPTGGCGKLLTPPCGWRINPWNPGCDHNV